MPRLLLLLLVLVSLVTSENVDVAVKNLQKWLTDVGNDAATDGVGHAEFSNVEIRTYVPEVRGVHAARNLIPDDIIMQIPHDCLITLSDAIVATPLTKALYKSATVDQEWAYLTVYVMQDYALGTDARFRYYYDTLPSAITNFPHFWNEEERKLLTGSLMLEFIDTEVSRTEKVYKEILYVAAENNLTFDFDFKTFNKFATIVGSRHFNIVVDGIGDRALAPLADMFNREATEDLEWEYSDDAHAFQMKSKRKITEGDQIFISYGVKSRASFLLYYGFTPEENGDPETGESADELTVYIFRHVEGNDKDLHDRKIALLKKHGSWYGADMTANSRQQATLEGLSLARLAVATTTEFEKEVIGKEYHPRKIPPLSASNEKAALVLLRKLVMEQSDKYETTLAEDEKSLASYERFSNGYHALLYMISEKKLVEYYLEFCDTFIQVLKGIKSTSDVTEKKASFKKYATRVIEPLLDAQLKELKIANSNSWVRPIYAFISRLKKSISVLRGDDLYYYDEL